MQENKEGREGGGGNGGGKEAKLYFITSNNHSLNLEARAHIPENDQRTTGESNKG